MIGDKYNIKVTEGNDFALLIPLKKRTFVSTGHIDEDIEIADLQDCVVKIGGVEYANTLESGGVQVLVQGLAKGTYDITLTAKYHGSDIRAAYFDGLTIVAYSGQSDAQMYLAGSPVTMAAAFVIGGTLTDEELETLKAEYRLKIAAAEAAKEAADQAKEEYEQKAEELEGVAKQGTDPTATNTAIKAAIDNIDIDTSDLAKVEQVKDGNDTAISVGKEIRSEVGTGSDTAAESGTLFAVVKWVKDKVKSIGTDYAKQGSNASANISDIQALIGYTISEIDGI